MKIHDQTTVERIKNPTRNDFKRLYLEQGKPVIVEDGVSHWSAISKWTDQYLRSTIGDETARVTCCPQGTYDTSHYFENMKVAKCIDLLPPEAAETKRYLAGVELRKQFQGLRDDYEIPSFLDQELPNGKTHFFFGWDTTTGYHFHPCHEAVLVQVLGKKRVRLIPPTEFRSLYPEPALSQYYNWSRVDALNPDTKRFPKFSSVQPIECELVAGEALFIPIHWWHAVFGLGKAISITFFWDAARQQWNYPNPGRRVAFRMAISRFAQRYRRLSAPLQFLKRLRRRNVATKIINVTDKSS